MNIENVRLLVILVMVCSLLGGLIIGGAIGVYEHNNKPRNAARKKMSDLSDDELFALQMAVFNEISKRGAAMLDVFEEFEGDKKK